jgi:hypothetical protein
VLGVQDAYNLLEILKVDTHNQRVAQRGNGN